MDTIIYNAHIVDGLHDMINCDGAIFIHDGMIRDVAAATGTDNQSVICNLLNAPRDSTFIDAHGCAVMPSFVDMHAHFRDPGQTEKESLETGINAAAAGGYGTVVLMPNTSPVISNVSQAAEIRQRAAAINKVTVFQSVSLTRGFDGVDTSHLDTVDASLIPVATEDGRDVASAAVMYDAMCACKKNNVIVSCHCEDASFAERAKIYRTAALRDELPADNLKKAEHLLRIAENTATVRNIMLAAETGCKIHIAHISTVESLELLMFMRSLYPQLTVTCEATPHHLCLTDAHLEIVNPPLRTERDRRALIQGIQNNVVICIATDHAPHTMKNKADGAPGFSGLETAFASCYTSLVAAGFISLQQLCACMSLNPARLLGGADRGIIAPGAAADLVIADLEKTWTVNPESFASKGKYSPFAGTTLTGKIMRTLYKGKTVYINEL